MKQNKSWKYVQCAVFDKTKQQYVILDKNHDINVRVTTKENMLEVSESCNNCKLSYWQTKVIDN